MINSNEQLIKRHSLRQRKNISYKDIDIDIDQDQENKERKKKIKSGILHLKHRNQRLIERDKESYDNIKITNLVYNNANIIPNSSQKEKENIIKIDYFYKSNDNQTKHFISINDILFSKSILNSKSSSSSSEIIKNNIELHIDCILLTYFLFENLSVLKNILFPLEKMKDCLIFIWIKKEILQSVIDYFENELGFKYVESIVCAYLKRDVSNENDNDCFVRNKSKYFSNSKDNILVFRYTKAIKSLILKHQRNTDTVFSFEDDLPYDYLYNLIETLLPGYTHLDLNTFRFVQINFISNKLNRKAKESYRSEKWIEVNIYV